MQGAQHLEFTRRDSSCREAGAEALAGRHGLEHLDQRRDRQLGHDGALVRPQVHQTARCEMLQRLPHRCARGLEPAADELLVDAVPGRKIAQDDIGFKRLPDLL